jgi:hypothetical protein
MTDNASSTNLLSASYIGVFLGAICTLGIYSFLYRENKFYRVFEHLFMAIAGSIGVVMAWEQVLRPQWWIPMVDGFARLAGSQSQGGVTVGQGIGKVVIGLSAFALGTFWYFISSRKYLWLARLVMGIVIGATSGLAFKMYLGAQMPQIISSIKPFYATEAAAGGATVVRIPQSINNFVFVVVLMCVMTYFFFAFEQKTKTVRGLARGGRWFLMITFGAYFGNTVMARMALFIERFQFLHEKWLAPLFQHFL